MLRMHTTSALTFAAAGALGLGAGEDLLVWSWRRILMGSGCCPLVGEAFIDACGQDAAEVFAAFVTFLQALGYASRRRLDIGAPAFPGVTQDERQVLTLIAAMQNGRRALFDAHSCWLARADRRDILTIGAGGLASALSANDLRLAVPTGHAAPACCDRLIAIATACCE